LDVAYKYWMKEPFKYKDKYSTKTENNSQLSTLNSQLPRFHHISTDEVYGTLGEIGLFTEETPYAPNSP